MIVKQSCFVLALVSLIMTPCHQSLVSPCPEVFAYENADGEWFGVVTVPSVGLGDVMALNVTLSIKSKLPSAYAGHIQLLGDRSEIFLKIINGLSIKYKVALPALLSEVPMVTSVVFNGEIYCQGPPVDASAKEIELNHEIRTGLDPVRDTDSKDDTNHISNETSNRNRIKITPKPPKKKTYYPVHSNVFNKKPVAVNTPPNKYTDVFISGGVTFESDALLAKKSSPHDSGLSFDQSTGTTATHDLDRFLNRDFLLVSDALPETPLPHNSDNQAWHDRVKPEYPSPPEENNDAINKKNSATNTTPKQYADQFTDDPDRIVFDYTPPAAVRPHVDNYDRPSWHTRPETHPERLDQQPERHQQNPQNFDRPAGEVAPSPQADRFLNRDFFFVPNKLPAIPTPFVVDERILFNNEKESPDSNARRPKPGENGQDAKDLEDFLFPDQ